MKIRAEDATNAGAVILEQPPLPIPHAQTFAELHREIRAYLTEPIVRSIEQTR